MTSNPSVAASSSDQPRDGLAAVPPAAEQNANTPGLEGGNLDGQDSWLASGHGDVRIAPSTTGAAAPPASSLQQSGPQAPAVGFDHEAGEITVEDATAIGPSSDEPTFQQATDASTTMMITLLLTNGARHPYKIDPKYLRKRNVDVLDNDPFNLSVYTLKELIWREWRDDWEMRPSSPSAIRLIHFGRLLDDKAPLKECRLNADAPNVIHMTVRPQEIVDEEDARTAKQEQGRDRDGNDRSPGCRCVIL